MVTWECGSCGANFQDAFDLESHRMESHDEQPRRDGNPRFPASAEAKPLGNETPAPSANELRSGRAGGMNERESERERLEKQHPTGAPGSNNHERRQGRTPSKRD